MATNGHCPTSTPHRCFHLWRCAPDVHAHLRNEPVQSGPSTNQEEEMPTSATTNSVPFPECASRPDLNDTKPPGGTHGQHREARACRQTGLAGLLPHPGRAAVQQDLRPQDRCRTVLANIESAKNTGSSSTPGSRRSPWESVPRSGWPVGSPEGELEGAVCRDPARALIPVWAKLPLANVSHADIQAWVTQLAARRSAATTKKAHRVFSLILDLAVRGGRLPRNVAQKIDQPAADGPGRAALCDHPAGGAVQRQNRRSACGFGWRPR